MAATLYLLNMRPTASIRTELIWQVSGSYLISAWAAVQVVDTLGSVAGFPDTLTRVAFVLLLLGLPVVLGISVIVLRRKSSTSLSAGYVRQLRPIGLAAAGAFVVLAFSTTGFIGMRSAGIGPAAPLTARGAFTADDRIVLADFTSRTGDTSTAIAVTEALRIDLEQSNTAVLVDPAYIRQTLERMQRDPGGHLDNKTALEVAQREGIKAVLVGEINAVGPKLVLSVRLLLAENGATLLALAETARDSGDVIAVVGRLSKKLRERIGEPLRAIRLSHALPQVTTPSLAALRKYAQAREALYVEGDQEKGVALTEEAISFDSTFAMAHVQLGIALLAEPGQAKRTRTALTAAFGLRDRLSEPERFLTEAAYYDDVVHDADRAITSYRLLRENYPRFKTSMVLNNLALLYEQQRDFRRASEYYRQALENDSSNFVPFINVAVAEVAAGKFKDATRTVERMRATHPEVPWTNVIAAYLASAQGDFARAEAELLALRDAQKASTYWQAQVSAGLAALARVQGRTDEAERHLRDLIGARHAQGDSLGALQAALTIAHLELWDRQDRVRGLRALESALQQRPLAGFAADVRPYLEIARVYSAAADAGRARAMLSEYERSIPADVRRAEMQSWNSTRALVAIADGDAQAAINFARMADAGPCVICALPVLGFAYDTAAQRDSAVAVWHRYLSTPAIFRLDEADAVWLRRVRARLAQLGPAAK